MKKTASMSSKNFFHFLLKRHGRIVNLGYDSEIEAKFQNPRFEQPIDAQGKALYQVHIMLYLFVRTVHSYQQTF